MKRIIVLILVLTVVLSAVSSVGFVAKDISSEVSEGADNENDFSIDILSDGTVSITKYSGKETALTIPVTISGYQVSRIDEDAFRNNYTITSVVIPNSVTSIGESAFYSCISLSEISIPDSVVSIESMAFEYCTSLKSIQIPDSVSSITGGLFGGCTSIDDITLPKAIEKIPENMFYNCSSLKSITLPEKISSIGEYAFYNCTSLSTIVLPSSVKNIGKASFDKSGLDRVYYEGTEVDWNSINIYKYNNSNSKLLSASRYYMHKNVDDFICHLRNDGTAEVVRYIGTKTQITIPSIIDNKKDNGTVQNNPEEPLPEEPLPEEPLPDGEQHSIIYDCYTVSSIGEYAFSDNTIITDVTVPDTVILIKSGAFSSCYALNHIYIGNGVAEIEDNAFGYCSSLTEVSLGNSVQAIGYQAFYKCTSLKEITLVSSVKSIGERAFELCTSLKTISLGNTESIMDCAFLGCTELSNIISSESVLHVGYCAFENTAWYDCQPDGVVYLGKVLYCYKGECPNSVTITSGTVSIAANAFSECETLKSIAIPDTVSEIGADAFWNTAWFNNQPDGIVYAGKVLYCCKNTASVPFSVSVRAGTIGIADGAFSNCTSLKYVSLPDSVISIGDSAFYYCSNLERIYIPASIKRIGYAALYTNSNFNIYYGGNENELETIENYELIPSIYMCREKNGYVYTVADDGTAEIVAYIGSDDCLDIPQELDGAPVKQIGENAFNSCKSLTRVRIPDSVTQIGGYAFENCSSLSDVIISKAISIVPSNAFAYCSKLRRVMIPKSVTWIYPGAFFQSGLSTVYYGGSQAEWKSVYKDQNFNEPLNSASIIYQCREERGFVFKVPPTTGQAEIIRYLGSAKILHIPLYLDGYPVISIQSNAFYYCSFLTSVVLPDTMVSVGYKAFDECTSLKTVIVPASVTDGLFMSYGYYLGKTWDDEWTQMKIEGFTVYGYRGSKAEQCAIDEGFLFVALDDAPPIFGNVDGDDSVTITDGTFIQRYLASIEIPFTLNEALADVDGDGDITVMDVTAIQYYLCHLKTSYPIGEIVT